MSEQQARKFDAFREWLRRFSDNVNDLGPLIPNPPPPYFLDTPNLFDSGPVRARVSILERDVVHAGIAHARRAGLLDEDMPLIRDGLVSFGRNLKLLENLIPNHERADTWTALELFTADDLAGGRTFHDIIAEIMTHCAQMAEMIDRIEANQSTKEAPLRKSESPSTSKSPYREMVIREFDKIEKAGPMDPNRSSLSREIIRRLVNDGTLDVESPTFPQSDTVSRLIKSRHKACLAQRTKP